MSVNITITVQVPLADIADIKNGGSASDTVKNLAKTAIEKEVRALPYQINSSPPQRQPLRFPLTIEKRAGQTFIVNVNSYTTMLAVAIEITNMEGLPMNQISLVFEGKEIWRSGLGKEMDARTVDFYGLREDALVYLALLYPPVRGD